MFTLQNNHGQSPYPINPETGPEVTNPKGVEVCLFALLCFNSTYWKIFVVQGWRWFNFFKNKRCGTVVNQSKASIKKIINSNIGVFHISEAETDDQADMSASSKQQFGFWRLLVDHRTKVKLPSACVYFYIETY